ADVLDLDCVGIDDDFFALGGDSLLALDTLAKIDKMYGRKLPLTALQQAKTPRLFLELLGCARQPQEWQSLVQIQSGTSYPSLFCVHPIGGDIMGYYALARHLGRKQTVYALRARGVDGTQEPCDNIEDMARSYIQEIRKVQPHGQYLLCGHSFG